VNYPQLLILNSEDDYYNYFKENYCRKCIYTFDNIRVFFPEHSFWHAFYVSGSRRRKDKSIFSKKRAERMPWIKTVLMDNSAELYVGWNNKKKCRDFNRRVAVVRENYVVIIQLKNEKNAIFITAFVGDQQTIDKIRSGPEWEIKSR